jgi:DNA processing protein
MGHGFRVLDPGDARYPPELARLDGHAPTGRLWLRGRIPGAPRIGIVGTRNADCTGLATARLLAEESVGRGHAVVSGGATGIDTAAHARALESGGLTLVVAATAPGEVYPSENASLFDDVVEAGGGVLTETPPGRAIRRFHFLRRNRLIAALSTRVVIVQAGHRSGALSTARWACKLGVDVLSVPGSPLSGRADGTNRLIERGEARILCRPGSLFQDSQVELPTRERDERLDALDGPSRRVAGLLGAEPVPPSILCRESGLELGELLRILLELELSGVARRVGHEGFVFVQ